LAAGEQSFPLAKMFAEGNFVATSYKTTPRPNHHIPMGLFTGIMTKIWGHKTPSAKEGTVPDELLD
jgi:hypothetical protein